MGVGRKEDEQIVRPLGPVKAQSLGLVFREDFPLVGRELEATLIRNASLLLEGDLVDTVYYGTALFSIPLEEISRRWRGSFNQEERADLLEALKYSMRLRVQFMRMARHEICARYPDNDFRSARFEASFSTEQNEVRIDLDVELPVYVKNAHRRKQKL